MDISHRGLLSLGFGCHVQVFYCHTDGVILHMVCYFGFDLVFLLCIVETAAPATACLVCTIITRCNASREDCVFLDPILFYLGCCECCCIPVFMHNIFFQWIYHSCVAFIAKSRSSFLVAGHVVVVVGDECCILPMRKYCYGAYFTFTVIFL